MPFVDYDVKYSNAQARWTCTCPDFVYRRSKTKDQVCKHIEEYLEKSGTDTPEDKRYRPRMAFERIVSQLDEMLTGYTFTICGSYRRKKMMLKDLDLVVQCNDAELVELRELIKTVGYIVSGGDQRITATIDGLKIDFRICSDKALYGAMILHFTGSKEENIRLRQLAILRGCKLSEYGLVLSSGEIVSRSEEAIYAALGLTYREPWERT